ncbi:thioredoxin fold domain-containing protein [Methylibium sp.]|uniref:thioredoxin family protein n=1 Tax=Methylibium sp. TaxID=2067992 RepID=UPI003D10A6BB
MRLSPSSATWFCGLAAVLMAAACSKTPDAGPESSTTRDALQAAVTPAVVAAVSAGSALEPGVRWRRPRTEADVESAFAEARAQGLPVFAYWGAVWCPPCNQVKATLFGRPDFIESSRRFVPLYLDGDLPGAQKLGAHFKVRGYPTMILFRPDGTELTRLPGEVDAQKYLQMLDLGLGAARPVKQLLAQARSAPAQLSADEWRLLAYYAWDTDEQQVLPAARRVATLTWLARTCPVAQAEARTRLLLKSLAAQADAGPATDRRKPDAAARGQVLDVLADERLVRENLDLIGNFAREITALLTTGGTPQREQMVGVWASTLDRLTADPGLSQGDRMSALISRVALARLGPAREPVDPAGLSTVLIEHVKHEAARADREVADDVERQSVIPSAAHALAQAGLLDDADRLLEAELKRSHSPYYAMLALAANARQRGDKPAALGWYERAYAAAQGPATRVQWGVGYVNALVDLTPEDAQRIAQGAGSVLNELRGQPDAFYERTARSLERMSGKLLAWSQRADGAAVLGRLRAQRDDLCAALPAADPQRPTCQALFAVPAAAPKANPRPA